MIGKAESRRAKSMIMNMIGLACMKHMHLAHQGCEVLAAGQSTQVFSGTANPVIAESPSHLLYVREAESRSARSFTRSVFPHLLIHLPLRTTSSSDHVLDE